MKFGLEKFTINFPMEKLKLSLLSFRKTNLLDLKKKRNIFFILVTIFFLPSVPSISFFSLAR